MKQIRAAQSLFRRPPINAPVIFATVMLSFGVGYLGMHFVEPRLQIGKIWVTALADGKKANVRSVPNPDVIINLPSPKYTQLDMQRLMDKWCNGSLYDDVVLGVLRECYQQPLEE